MTTDRDPRTHIVLSWLREDRRENAELMLLRTLHEVDTMPQRRSGWPARRSSLPNTVRLTVAAAAVVVVAITGSRLLPSTPDGSAPSAPSVVPVTSATPGPAATATPTGSTTPIATQAPARLPSAGPLEAGTYTIDSAIAGRPFEVTVPAGWSAGGSWIPASGVHKGDPRGKGDVEPGDAVLLVGVVVTEIKRDACSGDFQAQHYVQTPTAAELVSALSKQQGHARTGPTPVTIGGLAATRIEFSLPPGYHLGTDCAAFGGTARAKERLFEGLAVGDLGAHQFLGRGETTTFYVIDDAGRPACLPFGQDCVPGATVLIAMREAEASAADAAQLEGVVASVRFSP